jgi:predicted glycosyltransferase involved in capsule biosynthesis
MFLHSTKDDILFVSDDVEITNDNILNEVESRINGTTMMINNSFSHYICNRVELDSFGWFDERLVGFGEEDGDLIYRYLEAGRQLQSVWINGIRDAGSQVASSYEKGVGKYTKFNRDWIFTNKYVPDPNGLLGTFGFPHKRIGENIQQYPTEKFYWKHKHSL